MNEPRITPRQRKVAQEATKKLMLELASMELEYEAAYMEGRDPQSQLSLRDSNRICREIKARMDNLLKFGYPSAKVYQLNEGA